jgi:hypothetical protein
MAQFTIMPINAQGPYVGNVTTAILDAQNIICGSLGLAKLLYVNKFVFFQAHRK